jgi:maltose O-acetyltransferase
MKGASISPLAEIGAISIQGRLSGFKVGDYSTLGKVEIALHANLSIGKRVVINDGVRILTASHCTSCSDWKQVESDIYIDDYAWIAVGATILPGVSIGKGAVVGACAVVSKSVPDFSIVVGNPGKIISKRRNSQLNYNPCTFLALNNAWLNG